MFVANTAGALAGAMAAGFWLVPALGLQGTVRASAIAMLAASALVALGAERRVRLAVEVAALVVADSSCGGSPRGIRVISSGEETRRTRHRLRARCPRASGPC